MKGEDAGEASCVPLDALCCWGGRGRFTSVVEEEAADEVRKRSVKRKERLG